MIVTGALRYGGAMLATMQRDARIFISYRLRVPSQVLSALFTLTTFYYLAKIVSPDATGVRGAYFGYALVGIVATLILESAVNTAQIIRGELIAGNFERIVISPLGPIWGVISVILFPIMYSSMFAGVMLALAVAVYGVPIDAANILPALGVGILGAVSLACVGLLFVSALLAFKSAAGTAWVIAGLSLLGGAYFPLHLLPSWIRWTAYAQPFAPTVDLVRHLLIHTKTMGPVWLDLARLAGFGVVSLPVAVYAVRSAVEYSRRRGTLLEF